MLQKLAYNKRKNGIRILQTALEFEYSVLALGELAVGTGLAVPVTPISGTALRGRQVDSLAFGVFSSSVSVSSVTMSCCLRRTLMIKDISRRLPH